MGVPSERCYDTPRTVRWEMCQAHNKTYCQKFSNPVPQTIEKQNCHFEPNKRCELQTRSRPRKARVSLTPKTVNPYRDRSVILSWLRNWFLIVSRWRDHN